MAIWFLRGLRRGVVTTRYPKTVDAWTADLPSVPAFHSASLTIALADRVAGICPSGALRREAGDLIVDLGRCAGCGRCWRADPAAIEPSGEFLLSTPDRRTLIKRVPIRGGWG